MIPANPAMARKGKTNILFNNDRSIPLINVKDFNKKMGLTKEAIRLARKM